jgi:hypothetical protein
MNRWGDCSDRPTDGVTGLVYNYTPQLATAAIASGCTRVAAGHKSWMLWILDCVLLVLENIVRRYV